METGYSQHTSASLFMISHVSGMMVLTGVALADTQTGPVTLVCIRAMMHRELQLKSSFISPATKIDVVHWRCASHTCTLLQTSPPPPPRDASHAPIRSAVRKLKMIVSSPGASPFSVNVVILFANKCALGNIFSDTHHLSRETSVLSFVHCVPIVNGPPSGVSIVVW